MKGLVPGNEEELMEVGHLSRDLAKAINLARITDEELDSFQCTVESFKPVKPPGHRGLQITIKIKITLERTKMTSFTKKLTKIGIVTV